MLVRSPDRVYRTWIIDSRRWAHYRPRAGDIIIATYPKCGTTWMQRIVGLLVFQSPEPRPVMDISPWIDRRMPEPVEAVMARIEAQAHRRFLKAHLPADGLPIHDEVKYIHVARDGRDACMSFHNHASGFTPQMLEALDRAGMEDETIGRPYPRMPADPAEHFHRWLTRSAVPGEDDGLPMMSFFHFQRSWWAERRRANVLMVHYNDLKADLAGEVHRVADFLEITISPDLWPALVQAASFDVMRRNGDLLMGKVAAIFQGGGAHFFHKGTNERWRGVFRADDLALYDAKLRARLPVACARWVACGRRRPVRPRRTMALRRDLIAAAFPEPAPDDRTAMPLMTDEAIAASLDATLARLEDGSDLWLFVYGSLMWKPDLDVAERRLAKLNGWHRRFCVWQWRYRGSRERPGLMLALDRGGSCRGIACRIVGPGIREKVAGVWRREMIANAYRPRWIRAETVDGPVDAVAFVVNRDSGRYAGRLEDEAIAERLAKACGHVGPCAEYLLETVARCEELDIRDRHLWRLQALVAARLSAAAAPAEAAV